MYHCHAAGPPMGGRPHTLTQSRIHICDETKLQLDVSLGREQVRGFSNTIAIYLLRNTHKTTRGTNEQTHKPSDTHETQSRPPTHPVLTVHTPHRTGTRAHKRRTVQRHPPPSHAAIITFMLSSAFPNSPSFPLKRVNETIRAAPRTASAGVHNSACHPAPTKPLTVSG